LLSPEETETADRWIVFNNDLTVNMTKVTFLNGHFCPAQIVRVNGRDMYVLAITNLLVLSLGTLFGL
jgi:hypothetical protein